MTSETLKLAERCGEDQHRRFPTLSPGVTAGILAPQLKWCDPMAVPTDIRLHQGSRVLEVSFDSGEVFRLPCELLRVYSPSAEVQGHGPDQRVLQVGKEAVNIRAIHPVGQYAVVLEFDDGHSTGIYSWTFLHELGSHQGDYWQRYLDELAKAGVERKPA